MAWWKRDFSKGSRSPTPGPLWDNEEEEDTGEEERTPETMAERKGSDDDEAPPQTTERKGKRSISPAEEDPKVQKRARALVDSKEGTVSQEATFSTFAQRMMVCEE